MSWLHGAGALPGRVAEGDELTLEVSARALTRVAGMVFAVPLAALFAGALLGRSAAEAVGLEADMAGGLLGLACLALASTITMGNGGVMVAMLKITARRQRTDS